MLTAEEARQIYYHSIRDKYSNEVDRVEQLITQACNELKREVAIPFEDKETMVFSLEIYSRKDFLQNTLGSLEMVKVMI